MADPEVDEKSMMTYLSYFIKPCIQKIHKWAQSLMPQRKIKNMSNDWCSGIHLTALINVIRPGSLPNWAVLDEEHGINNVIKAMDVAKYSLGIKPSLTPTDMTSSNIDEISVAEYLAPFMLVEIAKPVDQVDLGQVTYTSLPGADGFILVAGEEINFSIDISKAGQGKLVPRLVASDGFVEILTTKAVNGIYTIKKRFMAAGSHRLTVLFNEKELISMPVEIRKTPEPNKCIADYSLLRDTFWNVGTNVQFKIDCTDAGGGELGVKVTNPHRSEILATKSVNTTGGKKIYFLNIVPESEGVYSIVATWAGKSIRGSPFNFTVADPKKVKIVNLPSVDRYTPLTGETLLFEVDTSKAFRGMLTGQVIDSSGAVSQLEIQELTKENHIVKHILTKAGAFEIKLYYNEVEVLRFAFSVSMAPVPSECVAHFNIEKNQSISVGQNVAFRVDCTRAGIGELTAMASCGIQKNDVPVRTSLDTTGGRQMYLVSLLPKVAGPYFVTILWANKPIPGSPFSFQASDESLVQFLDIPNPETFNPVVGDTITFAVDTSKAGKGIVVAQALYEGHQPQEFSANEKGKGLFIMKYVFPRAGNVDVPILFNGAQLTSMTYTVKLPPDASKCITKILQENEYYTNVSQLIKLSVDCTDAGTGEITVKCTNPQGNSLDAIIAKDTNMGRAIYRVQVQPDVVGTYRIVILWAATPVRKSPFTVEVADPSQVKFLKLPKEEFHPLTGDSIAFDIDATKAGKGSITGKIIYENTTEDLKIISKGAGMFGVKHVLTYPMQATIIINFNGVQILTKVFTIQLAPRADKCKVMIPEQDEYLPNVGQMIEFMVDTEAGTGELQIKATGPRREIKVSTDMESAGIHRVKFLPNQAGTYSVNILWAGEPVCGSPFKFEVADPNTVKFSNLPEIENFHPMTGDHLNFDIDVSRAGKGDLQVQLVSNGLTKDLQLTSKRRGIFSLQHTFERPCQIQLLVFYNGVQLVAMESAVKLAPDASKCRAIIQDQQEYLVNVGELVELAVNTSEAGNGVLTAEVFGPQREEVDIDITDCEDSYTIQFVPKQAGTYLMNVLWAGKRIPHSPFSFEIANPKLVKLLNLPKEQNFCPLIGENVTFDIDVNKAGQGKLHALVDTLDSGVTDIDLVEKRRGVYSLKHTVTSTGTLQFTVIFNGVIVSTLDYEAKLAPDSTQCQVTLHDTLLLVGQPIVFSVDCSKAGIGKLTINPMRKDVKAKIAESNSVYTVQAETHLVGEYSFEILWSGKVVGSHPVTYNVFDPAKVKVNLPIADKFCAMVDGTLEFEADTSKAGKGRLTSQVITDDGKLLDIELTQKGGIYAFSYKFTQAGSLTVVLLYNNINVFTLPWTCQVVDISQFHLSVPALFVEVGNEAKLEITNIISELAYLKVTATRERKPCVVQMSYEDTIAIGRFLIQEVGEYKIEARYSNKIIPGSPVLINGCNPSKCQFASQVSNIMHVGEAKTLVIKSNEAGPGTLKCYVSNNDLLHYDIKTGELSSKINLQPKAVGSCEITFTWADFPISNLQIDANIVDASLVNVTCITLNHQKDIKISDNITFLIDGSNAGQGDIKFNAKGPMSSNVEVDMVNNGDGTIVASFIATQVGKHNIDVTWGGKPVKDMPLIVDVKKNFDCGTIRAEGDALRLGIAGRKETVRITAKETGLLTDGELSATMITADGYDNDIKPMVEIKEKRSGVYVLTYIAEVATNYQLNITHEGQPITDSPFIIDIKPAPDASKCQVTLSDLLVPVGTIVVVDVNCREAGYGDLSFQVKDRAKKSVHISLSENDNIYTATFNAASVGEFTIEAYWSGSVIGDGQYKLNAFDLAKVKLVNLPKADGYIAYIGKVLEFDIDVSKAGKGTVSADVELNNGSSQTVELTEKLPNVYRFSYTFKAVGLLNLVIFFNGLKVLQTAWLCHVVDIGEFAVIAPQELCRIHENVQFCVGGVTAESKALKVTAFHTRQPAIVQLSYTDTGALAQFIPDQVGEYKVDVKHDKKQIAGSPFVIKVCNPAKCKTIGSIPSIIHVGETRSVHLKANEVGPGELQCFIEAEELLECNIKEVAGGTMQCDLTSKAVGTCNVELRWSDFAIPDSTFQVHTIDASLVTVNCRNIEEGTKLNTGDIVYFVINATVAGKADIKLLPSGPTTKYKEVDIVDNGDGTFIASFIATQVGKHTIDIAWGGKPIKGMPLIIDVKKAINCSSIRAEGDALRLGIAGRKETVTIIARETGLLADGGLSATMITADGYDNDTKPKIEIKKKRNGVYALTYIAEVATDYLLDITHEDQSITDSPFTVNVRPAPDASKCQVILPNTLVLVESTIEFDIDCTEAGCGKLTVIGKDPAKKNIPVEMSDDNSLFTVKFNAVLVGVYTFDVQWSGNAVPDNPVKFYIFDPTKVTFTKLPRSADFLAVVGQSITFDIDASKAGKGQIITQVVLSESYPKEVEVKGKNGLYNFKYDFVQAGNFELIILFNNYTVLTELWKCSVVDMSQIVIANTPEFVTLRDNITIRITGIPIDSKHLTVSASNMKQPTDVSLVYTNRVASATFCAEFVGEYKIEMKYGGKQLNDSPLVIKSCNPDACQISGQIPNILHVKESKGVTIQTSKAGPGLLNCIADFLTEGTPLECIINSAPNETTLMLKALAVGTVNIGLEWANFPIHKVPFEVQVVDASLVTVKCITLEEEKKIKTASKVVFEVDSRTAGRASLQFNVMGPRSQYKTFVRDNKDGTFTASFIAAQVGSHEVEFLWGGKPIPQSPLAIDVKKGIGFNSIIAEGKGLKLGFVNKKETVNVTASDSRLLKDDGDLSAEMNKVDGTESIAVEIIKTGLGFYTLSYIPRTLGKYELQINYEGKPIFDSPFYVDIKQPPIPSKCISEFPKTSVLAGTMPQFTVNCKEAGFGTLTVKVKDPTKKNVQVKISEVEEIHTVSFEVTTVGEYTVEVFWSGIAIPYSPFSLNCFDPSKIVIKNPAQLKFSNLLSTENFVSVTGDSISFDVDISNAGKGELKAYVIQEGGPAQDIIVSGKGEGIYTINYHMLKAGQFTLFVTFNSSKILMRTIKVREVAIAGKCRSMLQKVQLYAIHQPITFKVDCNGAGSGLLSAVAKDHNGKEVPVHISEHIQVYTLRFEATSVGKYTVDVFWSGKPIPNSPYTFEATKSKIKPPNPKDYKMIVGKDISYKINVGQTKKSELNGQVLFSEGGVAKMRITEKGGNYICSYQPTRSGDIEITIIYEGIRIFSQSVVIYEAPEASKCKVLLSKADQDAYYTVGQTISFKINCASAGVGELTATVDGPQKKEQKAKVTAIENDQYKVSFVSHWVGTCSVKVSWGGNLIPGAPLYFKVNDPKGVRFIDLPKSSLQAIVGREIKFDVDVSKAGKGILTANFEYEDGQIEEAQVVAKSVGIFSVLCQPKIAGPITIIVLFSGVSILSYPLTVKAAPNTSKCHLKFDRSKCKDDVYVTGEYLQFAVDCSYAGTGDLVVLVQDPNGKSHEVTLQEQNLTYRIKFEVTLAGQYKFKALWAGESIPGSPFTIEVVDPAKLKFVNLPGRESVGVVGKAIKFNVNVSKAGKGVLLVQAHYSNGTVSEFNKTEITKKLFTVSHIPFYTGMMDIIVRYSANDSITQSIMITKGAEASMCQVNLTAIRRTPSLVVRRVAEFSVDCSKAGTGNLLVIINSPCNKPVNADIKGNRGVFNVTFQPDDVGTYTIAIFWGDAIVPDSPFTVSAIDLKKIEFQDLPDTQGGLMSATVNQLISFKVDTSQAGKGNFTAKAIVGNSCSESFFMTSMKEGVYDLSYTPLTTGKLKFDFYYNDIRFNSMHWTCRMPEGEKLTLSIHRTSDEEEMELTEVGAEWIRIQMRTFKNWVNWTLKTVDKQVEELQRDFKNGLLLIALLQCLVKYEIDDYNPEPTNKIQDLENLTACLDLMDAESIKLVNIGPSDIWNGELKLILGLIWTLINHYHIHSRIRTSNIKTKKSLLTWFNWRIPNMEIVNFNVNWNSGIALCALIENLKPGACPQYAALSSENKVENCRLGINLAEKHFNVPGIIFPEDLSNPIVNDCSVMTYLSYFLIYFKDTLLQWIRQRVTFKVISNLDSDWCDGLCLTALCNTIKPGMLPDVETLNPKEGLKNITNAMIAAESELDVYIAYVQPADMANVAEPDDILNSIYLGALMTARPKIKATATGEALEKVVVGHRTQFKLEIGYGNIEDISIEIQNDSAMLESIVEKISTNEYMISYIPVALGPTTVTLKGYDRPIADSPYHVAVLKVEIEESAAKRPMKITLTGMNEIAPLTVFVQDPNKNIESVKLSSISEEKIQGIFVPPTHGEYTVTIKIDGIEIPGSPFKVEIKKLIDYVTFNATVKSPIKATAGAVTRVEILSDEAYLMEEGFLSIRYDTKGLPCSTTKSETFDSSLEEMQYTFIDEGCGCYITKFLFPKPGEYGMSVLLDGDDIAGSPFSIKVIEPVDASKCFIIQNLRSSLVNVGTKMVIQFDCTTAGDGELVTNVYGPEKPLHVHASLGSSSSRRIYSIVFVPKEVGDHTLNVLWGGVAIPSTPIVFTAVDSKQVKINLPSNGKFDLVIGETVIFDIDISLAGLAPLRVYGILENGVKQELPLQDENNGKFLLKYVTTQVGSMHLLVVFNEVGLKAIPVTISLAQDASKCIANLSFLKNSIFNVGNVLEFTVDCTSAGRGKLVIRARTSDSKIITGDSVKNNGIYHCFLKVASAGVHELIIQWADVSIPGGPFTFEVCDPNALIFLGLKKLYTPFVGETISFDVDVTKAGKAMLVGREVLHGGTKVYLEVVAKGDGINTLMYKALHTGLLKFVIYFNDIQVRTVYVLTKEAPAHEIQILDPEQPVNLPVVDPSKCVVINMPTDALFVGIEKVVMVSVDGAGSGNLEVSISDPSIIKTRVEQPSENIISVIMVPTTIGKCSITLKWGGIILPNMPTQVNVCDPRQVTLHGAEYESNNGKINRVIKLTAKTVSAGKADLAVRVTVSDGTKIPVDVSDNNNDSYSIAFTPTKLGKLSINVTWGGIVIPNSPFHINITTGLDSSDFYVIGNGIEQAVCGEIMKCEIVGTESYLLEKGILKIKLEGENLKCRLIRAEKFTKSKEKDIQVSISDDQNCHYPIQYMVPNPGTYILTILLEGTNITKSPFIIPCVLPPSNRYQEMLDVEYPVECPSESSVQAPQPTPVSPFKLSVQEAVDPTKILIEGHNSGCAGIPGNLLVLSSHKDLLKEGGLSANMVREVGANLEGQEPIVQLTDDHSTTYKLTYLAPIAGDYKLTVTYDNINISNSPFSLCIQPPTGCDKCRVQHSYLDEDHNIENPVDFSVDVTHAGPGLLTIKVTDPKGSQLKVHSTVNRTLLNVIHYLTFNPKITGMYTVKIFWNDKEIPGTPFTVNVIDPNKCTIKGLPLKDCSAVLNEHFSYSVHTKNAGNGKVHSVISRPGQDNTILEPIRKGSHEYQFQYKPDKIGKFSILIFFAKKELNGSPFQCKAVDICSVGVVLSIETVVVCEPFEFCIKGSFPDAKNIKAIAYGPKDDTEVEVYPPIKNSHVARFIPHVAGWYKVFVEYSGQQIPNSPFSVACIDPGKCKIIGDLPLILQVGKKAEFVVETIDSGPGTISVTVNNEEDNHNCTTVIEAQCGSMHKIMLTPKIIGEISIQVLFGGYGIPRTPFKANICDATKCNIIADFIQTGHGLAGKTITFTLVAFEAGRAKPAVKAQGPTIQCTVDVMEVEANTYKYIFTPLEVGKHLIHVIWGRDHIPGSPFQVDIGQSDKGVCTAAGPGLREVVAGEPTKFNIHTNEPGLVDNGILGVHVRNAIRDVVHVQIEDQHDGKYVVTYTAEEPGAYLAEITYNGKDIAGSPFKVNAVPKPDASKCRVYGPALESKNNRYTNVAQEFYIDTVNAGQGKLNVLVRGPNDEQCAAHIKKDGKVYSFSFNAEYKGLYKVIVLWSNNPVPGSPFKIKIQQAVNAKMVKAYGPGLQNGKVGEYGEFTIETKNAGRGNLTVHVHDVTGSFKVETFAKDPDKPHIHTAKYISRIAGKFDVFIKWAGTQIPGSPFTLLIADASGVIPSATVSNVQYQASVATPYKQSQTEENLSTSYKQSQTEENSYKQSQTKENPKTSYKQSQTEETSVATSYKQSQTEENPRTSYKQSQTKENPRTSYKQLQTEENLSASYKQLQTKENLSTSYKQSQTKENPRTSYKQSQTKENPRTSYKQSQTEANSSTSYKQSQTEENSSISCKQSQTEENSSTSYKQSQTKENLSTSYKQSQTKENPKTSYKQSQTKENPRTSYKQSQTKENSSTSYKQSQTKENSSTSYKQSQTKENSSTSYKQSQTKENSSTSYKQSQTEENPSTSYKQSQTKENPRTSYKQSQTKENSSTSYKQSQTKENSSTSYKQSQTKENSSTSYKQSQTKENSSTSYKQSQTEENSSTSYKQSQIKENSRPSYKQSQTESEMSYEDDDELHTELAFSGEDEDDFQDQLMTQQDDSPYLQFLNEEKKKIYCCGRRRKSLLIAAIVCLILIFGSMIFTAAVVFIYARSIGVGGDERSINQQICDNPPIIHLSFDGYRADYYERMLNPNLQFILNTGVRAEYMRSQYPTDTLPNHYTIMTGLYPEYHGIVNEFLYGKYTNEPFRIIESQWWLGEPLWVTAKRNDIISGVYFWPGSDVPGIEPDYYFDYNRSVPFLTRISTALSWLDLRKDKRPQFIALYFDQPDSSAHEYGPHSLQVNESIRTVDAALGSLIYGLKERNILNCVNLIVTSDHGMQATSEDQALYLEDYVGVLTDGIHVTCLGTILQFNIYPPADKMFFYNNLKNLPHVQVFYQEDVPYRLRIGHNLKTRYGDIIVIPDTGWFVTSRSQQYSFIRVRNGEHGYDNNAETMRAFMAARGPAFKENYVSSSFDNIQLYNLECALLGISPATNNGTFGSLYSLLKPDVVKQLPKEQSFEPINSGHMKTCQFPLDVAELFDRLGCNDCLCSPCQLDNSVLLEADLELNLTTEQISYYQSYHIVGGIPQGGSGSGSCLLTDQHKISKYSTTLHIPLWLAYRLDGNNLPVGSQNIANDCSRMDPRVSKSESANCTNLNIPNYVRGTLANFDSLANQYFTNQIPQLHSFYQDVWQVLQEKLINWAAAYSSIYVISGSILDSDHDGFRDSDEDYDRWTGDVGSIAIPTQFYSIAIRCRNNNTNISNCLVEDIQALGIVMNHEDKDERSTKEFFEFRITTVREIEKITDINFFPELTPNQQNKVELEIITDLWLDDFLPSDKSTLDKRADKSTLNKRANCLDCICPNCEANRTYALESDSVFNISQSEIFNYLSYHSPWGVPQSTDDSKTCVLTHSYFTVKYSMSYHIPLWVAYRLNGNNLISHLDQRNCFRRDPRISIMDSSNCSDYESSGFDLGHLAPNGDFDYEEFAQLSTFVFTNVAPQYHEFNAGLWLTAENKIRQWALTYSVVHVISGSILGKNRRDQNGNYNWWIRGYSRVAVPTHFYKVLSRCGDSSVINISDCPTDNLETLTFLFQHVRNGIPEDESDTALFQSLTTIRNVETLTGLNFFTHLTIEDQDKIELKVATALWD